MIKGCQRKIIFIQGGEASPFETAYFVLKKDSEECCHGGDDILLEANRIIERSIPDACMRRRRRERLQKYLVSALLFAAGLLSGASSVALACLFRFL